jgi:hypothetical protein
MSCLTFLRYAFRNICLRRTRSTFFVPTGGSCGPRRWGIKPTSALLDLTKFGSEAASVARRPAGDETAPQFAPDNPPSREGAALPTASKSDRCAISRLQRRDPKKPLDVVVLSLCFCITSYARGRMPFPRVLTVRQLVCKDAPQAIGCRTTSVRNAWPVRLGITTEEAG